MKRKKADDDFIDISSRNALTFFSQPPSKKKVTYNHLGSFIFRYLTNDYTINSDLCTRFYLIYIGRKQMQLQNLQKQNKIRNRKTLILLTRNTLFLRNFLSIR